MNNKIIAVIVTYNPEPDLLIKQFNSLISQVDRIIYVDNNSSNDFRENLKSDRIEFILNEKNLGLGKAQNQGIENAFGQNATHVILFDQDSIADQNLVLELVNTQENTFGKDNVALVGSAIYNNYDTPPTVAKVVKKLGWSITQEFLKDVDVEVEYCIASGSLISREAYDNVGKINEDLFIDALDLEWCHRAKYKGFRILQSSKAKIYHQLGNGAKDKILSHSPLREFYICRNNILLIKMKHIPLGYRLRKLVLTPLRPLNALFRLKIRYFLAGIKGILKGI